MEPEERRQGKEGTRLRSPQRLSALAALAVGAGLVVLSLTGLAGVDRRLQAVARDADRASAPQLREAAYPRRADGRCQRLKRPAAPQRRL